MFYEAQRFLFTFRRFVTHPSLNIQRTTFVTIAFSMRGKKIVIVAKGRQEYYAARHRLSIGFLNWVLVSYLSERQTSNRVPQPDGICLLATNIRFLCSVMSLLNIVGILQMDQPLASQSHMLQTGLQVQQLTNSWSLSLG